MIVLLGTDNGCTVSQFREICKEAAKDIGVSIPEDLEKRIKNYFQIKSSEELIFSSNCWEDALEIIQ